MSVEGYDLVMIGILAVASVLGYFKGMVWQLAWIAGIFASSFVAFRYGTPLASFFGQQAPWNRLAAMLALYAATSIAVWLIFRVISGAINAVHLSAFDHQMGLLLGMAKGVLLCVVVTFFAVTLAPAYREQIVASQSGRLVAELIVRADVYLPKDVHETVDPFVKQFESELQKPIGMPGASAAQQPNLAGGQSPLRTMWEGVSSAAAWAGTEQGGQQVGTQQAGGALPVGSSWFVPRASQPAAQPATSPPVQPPTPARSTGSAFSQPAAPPHPFPVGAQTPLPLR
ncbi:MAG: CvpA family protein [Planctomycetia bacterium]|nr:CvpA family protein [Planctomycetia bacterium]